MERMVQEVTARFYQSLKVEESLFQVFCYLKSFFPMANLHVAVFNAAKGYILYLASATQDGGHRIEEKIKLSGRAVEEGCMLSPGKVVRLASALDSHLIRESLTANPDVPELQDVFTLDETFSVMTMAMDIGSPLLGICSMAAPGRDQYTEGMGKNFFSLYRPINSALLNLLQHRDVEEHNRRLIREKKNLLKRIGHPGHLDVIGIEGGLEGVMKKARQVAGTGTPVLITGETGTGKEVIANAIHQMSPFKDGPMISVNCGAIPLTLVESELFGHEKGAFTGALDRKPGFFEQASEGTLFLDEIGDLPLPSQVKFLRVLQEKQLQRVGGIDPVPVETRIIAATHNNLEHMVAEKLFREDLWFRLSVFPISIPPLRKRQQDIPSLVNYFLEKKQAELHLDFKPRIAPGAMDRLMAYAWPGNIRELENCVERHLIVCEGRPLSFSGISAGKAPRQAPKSQNTPVIPLDDMIIQHIRHALRVSGGKVGGPDGAAELLGLNPSTLWGKIRKYGLTMSRRADTL